MIKPGLELSNSHILHAKEIDEFIANQLTTDTEINFIRDTLYKPLIIDDDRLRHAQQDYFSPLY